MSIIPFDDRDGVIWFDGALIPWRSAQVHVLTHALHYGSSVFEGARAYGGQIFKLTQHSQRLVDSGRILGFEIPYDVAAIDQACRETLVASGLQDAYVRPVAWRGSEVMGVSAQASKIHLAIAVWEWPSYFSPEERMRGIRLARAPYRRPAPDTAPIAAKAAGLYMICTISKHEAERNGFQDALMLDYRGYLAEATGANLFLIRDGVIHTPLPDCFLNGITRQTVIALARAKGIEVIERHIEADELSSFSEIFLTGTAAEVTPVREIDGLHFTPGTITQTLLAAYADAVRA